MSCDLGVYGMAVMGLNLALNAASRGFRVCIGNRTLSKVEHALDLAEKEGLKDFIEGSRDMKQFVESIKKPRRVIMLVQAGAPVDALLVSLIPLLSEGDVLVDGGNEFFENTERRLKECKEKGIHYLGMGISGGEEGARRGPSLMPGGDKEGWELMRPILLSIAAQVQTEGPPGAPGGPSKNEREPGTGASGGAPKGGPPRGPPKLEFSEDEVRMACVAFMGPGGAGNYVKMVHNGIEYGDMQIIAEVYSILRYVYNMSNGEISSVFSEWNKKTELESFLIEVTAAVLKKKSGEEYLVDLILDTAGSKGTGKWTVQQAAEWGVAVPCLSAALDMRYISSHRGLRERLSSLYAKCMQNKGKTDLEKPSMEEVREALYVAKICCYAQGLNLLQTVSREKGWGLSMAEVCRIWKGGCIIRAKFLNLLEKAFRENPDVENLLLIESVRTLVTSRLPSLCRLLSLSLCPLPVSSVSSACPLLLSLPALSAAYHYIAAVSSLSLPTNLIQAQRDCFGAHGFELRDKRGQTLHEKCWMQPEGDASDISRPF